MGAGELVAISRLLKYTGKAIRQIMNSDEGQMVISDVKKGTKTVTDNTIKPVAQKGKELYFDHVLASNMRKLRKKADILMALESRSEEDDGVIISDEEIKKVIEICDNKEIIDDVLLKYLLMLFAIKSRGMVNYIKDIAEARTYIDMLFTDVVDESILNLKSIDEISKTIRIWIPVVINNILDQLDGYENYKKKTEEIKNKIKEIKKQEKEYIKREIIKEVEEEIQRSHERKITLKGFIMLMMVIVPILWYFN